MSTTKKKLTNAQQMDLIETAIGLSNSGQAFLTLSE